MKRGGQNTPDYDSGVLQNFSKCERMCENRKKYYVFRGFAKALLQKRRCERIFGYFFFCRVKMAAAVKTTDGKLSKVYYMRKSKKTIQSNLKSLAISLGRLEVWCDDSQ
jgi:hypothetical protein